MKCHYGYAKGIDGNDGEELDIYLGENDSDIAYIIEQIKEDGSYDEDKIMLGFASEQDAIDMFLQHMPAYMLGEIREFPVDRFVNALYGEPEDRRDQKDLVPSEEKKAFIKVAGDLINFIKAAPKQKFKNYLKSLGDEYLDAHFNNDYKKREHIYDKIKDMRDHFDWILSGDPLVSGWEQNTDRYTEYKNLFVNMMSSLNKRIDEINSTLLEDPDNDPDDDPDGGEPIPEFEEEPVQMLRAAEDKAKSHKKKKTVKTKSDYVGPASAQVGGIGGPAADSDVEAGKQDLAQALYANLDNPEIMSLLDNPKYNIDTYALLQEGKEGYFKFVDSIVRRLATDPDFQQSVEALVGPEPQTEFEIGDIEDLPEYVPEQKLKPLSKSEMFSWLPEDDIPKEMRALDIRKKDLIREQELAPSSRHPYEEAKEHEVILYGPEGSGFARPKEEVKAKSPLPHEEDTEALDLPLIGSGEFEQVATKTWPEDDIFDNEFTDGTEERENRDIPREEK
jgi:hypothetical protein